MAGMICPEWTSLEVIPTEGRIPFDYPGSFFASVDNRMTWSHHHRRLQPIRSGSQVAMPGTRMISAIPARKRSTKGHVAR